MRAASLGVRMTWLPRLCGIAERHCGVGCLLGLHPRTGWTSDRLARRGLPHQDAYPFCCQMPESINHLLVSCVFVRSVWHPVLMAWGREEWAPLATDNLLSWCTSLQPQAHARKDFHTIILLVCWELWKHRNAIVFDGASPSVAAVLRRTHDEGQTWHAARLFRSDLSVFFHRLYRWNSRE